MAAPRLLRCAVGWGFLVPVVVAGLGSARGFAQQASPVGAESPQIAALADRLAVQLLSAHKKKPFVLDLTLPGEVRSPLGAWLADRISESLAQSHPELEVISRSVWDSAPATTDFFHDRNQENSSNEARARSLGAEVLVNGNFAAVPTGIGVTLMANDVISGGNSHFEALSEIPLSAEMKSLASAQLPDRPSVAGISKASMGGVGTPVCELCPAPEYTYVARAKRLSGIVILQVWVSTAGAIENATIVRAPNESLGKAAVRAVNNWRFKPATNASGDVVPVVVDVAVSFRLNAKQLDAAAFTKKSEPRN